MTMLFSAKRFDISDQVIRTITRAEKREEMSKKQQKRLKKNKIHKMKLSDNPALTQKDNVC